MLTLVAFSISNYIGNLLFSVTSHNWFLLLGQANNDIACLIRIVFPEAEEVLSAADTLTDCH